MEEMTDYQYKEAQRNLLRLVLEMMTNSKDLKEAREKVEALIDEIK